MKNFINMPACHQIFWLGGWLGRKCAFSQDLFTALAAATHFGLTDDTQHAWRQFYRLITCPSAREKGSAAACSAEEPQGIPAENTGLMQCALPNWKWTNCWLFKSKHVAGLRQTVNAEHLLREYFQPGPCSSSSEVCVGNPCRLARVAQGHGEQTWFPGVSGTLSGCRKKAVKE